MALLLSLIIVLCAPGTFFPLWVFVHFFFFFFLLLWYTLPLLCISPFCCPFIRLSPGFYYLLCLLVFSIFYTSLFRCGCSLRAVLPLFEWSHYPISTLPEHLHSTSLSYAETTGKHTKLKETRFLPSYRSLPVNRSPTPPYTPLHRETWPHPHLLIILVFSAQQAGRASGRSHLLCLLRP